MAGMKDKAGKDHQAVLVKYKGVWPGLQLGSIGPNQKWTVVLFISDHQHQGSALELSESQAGLTGGCEALGQGPQVPFQTSDSSSVKWRS